ncbi:PGGHG glucosidase, partial [Amazona guildingii]|nr:PGGHG glucosidase [Amazona guildingii]
MADGSEDPAVFSSSSLPADPRLLATVTNAYLGTRVYRDTLHVSGVYSGAAGDTHRADVPSPANVRMAMPGAGGLDETFALDTRTGTFSHELRATDFVATQQIYAHYSLVHLMVVSITIRRSAHATRPITIQLQTPFEPKSQDLDLKQGPDFQGAQNTFLSCHPRIIPATGTEKGNEGSRGWGRLHGNGFGDRGGFGGGSVVSKVGELNARCARSQRSHTRGHRGFNLDPPSLFYLLSSITPHPVLPPHGISPGGVANGARGEDYWGHVFWDQETWIFPNILLFYPKAARAMLEYRIHTLEGALHNAREQGYEGAKFPWESAATGREVCPEEIYGAQEIHVSGDVLLAFEQYYHTTQDQKLFREDGGWRLVCAVAQYWCSRMVWSEEEQCYHIRDVMPPDEHHCHVDNSAYTNAVAQRSLTFAADLARDLMFPVPEQWLRRARSIKVPFDAGKKYHPEYDGYSPGEPVKQADVVLLGFPLMHPMSPAVRRNDLEVYEPVTEPHGPAMTWSMFAVGWLELKEVQRAQALLNKCFSHITEPFKIWVENSDGSGAVNFLTGMGGFLQAILFGYTGFRITRSSLRFDPALPDDIHELNVTGVSYLGNKLRFSITREAMGIEVTESPRDPPALPLEAVLAGSGQRLPLHKGQRISLPMAAGCIRRPSPG